MHLLSLSLLMTLAGGSGGACLPDPKELWKLSADDPRLLQVLTHHALLCRAEGNYPAAETLVERVVLLVEHEKGKDAPELAGPLSNLAAVYQEQGRRAEAEPILRRAYRLSADGDAETRAFIENNLALIYWDRGEVARAEPLLRRSAEALGGSLRIAILANLATLYRSTGRLAEAEEVTRQVLQADERCWQAWRNLAAIHRLRKDFVKAGEALERASMLDGEGPWRAETLFEKALLASSQRDWARAGEAIQQAVEHEESLFGAESVNLIPYVELQAKILAARKEKARSKEAALRARLLRAAL